MEVDVVWKNKLLSDRISTLFPAADRIRMVPSCVFVLPCVYFWIHGSTKAVFVSDRRQLIVDALQE